MVWYPEARDLKIHGFRGQGEPASCAWTGSWFHSRGADILLVLRGLLGAAVSFSTHAGAGPLRTWWVSRRLLKAMTHVASVSNSWEKLGHLVQRDFSTEFS